MKVYIQNEMNDIATKEVTEFAHSIGDLGALLIIGAAFILLSLGMWVAIFKWFKSIINQILEQSKVNMNDMIDQQRENTRLLESISEGLRAETQLRLKNLSNMAFDLSVEQVCRLIKRIREENHIADKEATKLKIRNQLHIIHEDRNSRFDPFTYRGVSISSYCNNAWIEDVAKVVEGEIYHPSGPNNARAYTNVKMAYDNIKLDFYHRMQGMKS